MPTHIIRAREPAGGPAAVGVDRSAEVIDQSPEAIERHLEDAAHFPGGRADGVARPRSEAEVAALVKGATRVLPIGAQSSVTGGATPVGGLVLSTERLTAIQESGQHHVRVRCWTFRSTPCRICYVRRGRWYAPVPTFTGAFVGGVVATNAAGAATFKYGATRAWVDGLTVVLPCGHVLDLVTRARSAPTPASASRFVRPWRAPVSTGLVPPAGGAQVLRRLLRRSRAWTSLICSSARRARLASW